MALSSFIFEESGRDNAPLAPTQSETASRLTYLSVTDRDTVVYNVPDTLSTTLHCLFRFFRLDGQLSYDDFDGDLLRLELCRILLVLRSAADHRRQPVHPVEPGKDA